MVTSQEYYRSFSTMIERYTEYYNAGITSEMKNYDLSKDGYMYDTRVSYIDKNGNIKKKYKVPIILSVIISGIATTISMLIMVGKNKMIRKATNANEYLDKGSVRYSESYNNLVNTYTTTRIIVESSSGGGGGGGGHSSFGGHSGGGHSGGGGRC